MIRVNLQPQKKPAQRGKTIAMPTAPGGGGGGSSQMWLFVVLGVVLLEIVGLILFHRTKGKELDDQKAKNSQLQGQIANIQALVTQHQEVKKELELLRAREDAIAQLQAARTGPTAALLELSQLMTQGKGPTVDPDRLQQLRKENPLQVFNINWDSRRLWLTSYLERSRTVALEGFAQDSQDVSELAYRLKTSSYFYDVRLLPGKKGEKGKDGKDLVSFGIEMKVRY